LKVVGRCGNLIVPPTLGPNNNFPLLNFLCSPREHTGKSGTCRWHITCTSKISPIGWSTWLAFISPCLLPLIQSLYGPIETQCHIHFFQWVPSKSWSSLDSFISSSSSSFLVCAYEVFNSLLENLSTPLGMSCSSGIMIFLAYLIVHQSTTFFSTSLAHTIWQIKRVVSFLFICGCPYKN
jgi:hypothetical protein